MPVVRLGEIVLIHDLKPQGLSVSAIARQLGLDRKTVRRHLERGLEPPAYGPRAPWPTLIAPFEDYLAARVAACPELSGIPSLTFSAFDFSVSHDLADLYQK